MTREEVLAKAAKLEAAGRTDDAAQLRAYAETLPAAKPDAATVEAKAAKLEAAGRADDAVQLRAYAATLAPVAAPGQASGETTPDGRAIEVVDGKKMIRDGGGLRPLYREDMLQVAQPTTGNLTPTAPPQDTFGETAAAMTAGPMAAADSFAAGFYGNAASPSREFLANDPLTSGLPGPVLTGLGKVGDAGGALLSGAGAAIGGALGLATELVPGQDSRDEAKLGNDLLGMSQFAVPELAGVSSVVGKASSMGVAVPQIGTKPWRNAFGASVAKPSTESLRAAKNVAYDAVDAAGETFDVPAMTALRDRVKSELNDGNYVEGVDRETDAVLTLLDRKAGSEMSLGQLDKMRQEFYRRLAAKPNEVGIRDAIDAIDEMIAGRADTSDLMTAARLSNSRYKKAELLDLAFQKAKDQTDATGSGGNILNKYRQAVVQIIDNPKNAKWFNKDEIDLMRKFVTGTTGQNALRLAGKLSPSGNGLMLALNLLGAAGTGGSSLLVTGAAIGAKAAADAAALRGGTRLIGKMAGEAPTMPAAAPATTARIPTVAGAIAAQEAANSTGSPEYEALWGKYGK